MHRRPLRLTLGAAALLAVLGCAGTGRCGGGHTDPAPATVEKALTRGKLPEVGDVSTWTDEDVDRVVKFLIPYVEEVAGAKFTTPPPGRLATPASLSDVLEDEAREALAAIYDVPDEVIAMMARDARGSVPMLLGKYAPSTGMVYLSADNVAASSVLNEELGENAALKSALVIMAHELAHALQDQAGELKFAEAEDLDHFDGMRGITEGHANWVAIRVARMLDIEDAFWAKVSVQGWGKDGLEQPGAFSTWMLYGQGMTFCEHHSAEGGTDRLWEIIKAPPRSTTMLFRPERYAPDVEVPVDLAGVLRGVDQELTKVSWVAVDTHVGEGPLRKETQGLDAERVDRTLDGIAWGHERMLYHQGGGGAGQRRAWVQVLRFDTPEAARELVELLSDGLEAQAAARTAMEADAAAHVPGVVARTWSVDVVPYDGIEGDAVIRRVVGPVNDSGARLARNEEQALWVVRGETLVVVRVAGFRPGNRLARAVTAVFENLPE